MTSSPKAARVLVHIDTLLDVQFMKAKIKRAYLLYQQRGLAWLLNGVLGALPLAPRLFPKLAPFAPSAVRNSFVFLSGVCADQLWGERRAVLARLAQQNLSPSMNSAPIGARNEFGAGGGKGCGNTSPASVLEIGTWMGRGSTQIWLQALPPGSSLLLIDAWRRLHRSRERRSIAQMDNLHHVAINSTLEQIYRAEAERGISVHVVRATSQSFLPMLKDKSFDVIYIDGSHYYQDVKKDIIEAKRLIRNGGLICGDDLDLEPTPDLIKLAREHIDIDFVVLPDGRGIHPGVMVAVSEELPHVEIENGVWWSVV
jgi:predicted O-methyltransferase YrrM